MVTQENLFCLKSNATENFNILAGFYEKEDNLKIKLLAQNIKTGSLIEMTENHDSLMLFENQVVVSKNMIENLTSQELIKELSREIKVMKLENKEILIAELNMYVFENILQFAEK